ncbi:acireductone dioxygenase-like [Paramacrobiotus metropolitanus]|uniref:acireductone dioxygenase-like n=1 Tax=Paramacrobiotus metropolitanus TaxID=2943436 RepID=UPI0024457F7D|nr:acireductone dioxygenase-like [Paramacrobiotus metropolitanus]
MADKTSECTKKQCDDKCNHFGKPNPKNGWYLRDTIVNRYEENKTEPPEYLTDEQIYLETEAIISWVDLGNSDDKTEIEKRIRAVRNMPVSVEVECDIDKEKDEKALDEKADKFFAHHFHPGEVMRVVTEGSGYFDVKDLNNRWIRRPLSKGDIYIISSGCYHRVCLDTKKKMKAVMLHYDKKGLEQKFWPESETDPMHVQYIERMKCLRRSLNFQYKSRPGSVDCDKTLNRP